ncbi:MAG: hypothetical protein CSA62_14225 [Planctomycetota bacterium]|nr:MAG: hypothetical protein CSA62_14225 [Planctomycetota bacterium]
MQPLRIFAPLLLIAALLAAPLASQNAGIPEPKDLFGFTPGEDGRLLSYEDSIRYFEALAQASPRIEIETIGKTSFGREIRLAWIGAEPLLRKKQRILAMHRDISDPRRLSKEREQEILEECPNLLLMSMSMHSSEVGAGLYAPKLAHELITREDPIARSVRERVLIALLPCTNPDGMTMIADWFERRKKAGKARARLPWLYQKWAGHDNNRDWFMLNLPETRVITRQIYERIRPTVLLDMHQMGGSGPRFFVPPYADPINPNIDPVLTQALNLLGTRIAHDMTLHGCKGVVTSTVFDNWWNGGNRNVPFRHNILGILTECANANLGDPVIVNPKKLRGRGNRLPEHIAMMNHPDPWTGGKWGLGEILRYHRQAAWSVLRTMARERKEYLSRKILLGRRAIASPQQDGLLGYRIKTEADQQANALRLVANLQALGVEVQRIKASRDYFVSLAQPYRAMAKDLLERQRYPRVLDAPKPHGRQIRPYDASGWTLPLQLGVAVTEVRKQAPSLDGPAQRLDLDQLDAAASKRWKLTREAIVHSSLHDLDSGRMLFLALASGHAVRLAPDGRLLLAKAGKQRLPGPKVELLRIGIYHSFIANMDEGWTRYLLDKGGVPYSRVTAERVAKGDLQEDFDVLLIPSISRSSLLRGHGKSKQLPEFVGGIGSKGLQALHQFVHAGGRLVAWGKGVDAVLPIPGKNVINVLHGLPGRGVTVPGSILRVFQEGCNDVDKGRLPKQAGRLRSTKRLTEGLCFDRPARWGVLQRDRVALGGSDLESLLTYPEHALLSGYLVGGKQIAMMSAYARVASGKGEYLLMGFRPQNRGQTLATLPLLLRTLIRVSE